MLNNKEETKLLSDDEFERIGRRKKTIVSIIIIMIILIAAILAFGFIRKNENINVEQNEVAENAVVKGKTEDEPVISDKELTENLMTDNDNQVKIQKLVNMNLSVNIQRLFYLNCCKQVIMRILGFLWLMDAIIL